MVRRGPVVVVGAGLAGLSSALRLRDVGHPVVVLEAADVAGGRARATVCAGGVVDAGSTFIAAQLRPEQQGAVASLRFGAASKVVAGTSAPASRWRTVVGGRHLKSAWRIGDVLAGVAPHVTASPPSEQGLVDDLAEVFGLTPAQLIDPKVIDWAAQPHVGGTYIAYAPGQVTRYGPVLEHAATPPIWFAGAERSSWPDSMEGAVESGARAAHQVIQHLERNGR